MARLKVGTRLKAKCKIAGSKGVASMNIMELSLQKIIWDIQLKDMMEKLYIYHLMYLRSG